MLNLVTGGAGFIGRRLVHRLVADGERARVLALPGEDVSGLDAAEVARGDITAPATLAPAFAGVDRVFHLAAVVGDWGPEPLFWRVNVDGTRHVLDAAAAAGCARVVMVSSIVVYGSQLMSAGVCDELATAREHGVGPYSRTKRASEELALDYHAFGRVPVTVVRPGNVYGPGSGLWVDEVAANLRRGAVPLIDGGDGDASMAYVDNVVDVCVRAARAERAAGRIYNANDGSGATWRDYLTDLARAAGARPPARAVPGRLAGALAAVSERVARLRRATERPLVTVEASFLLRSRARVPVRRAEDDLGYRPLVPYAEAMDRVARYLQS